MKKPRIILGAVFLAGAAGCGNNFSEATLASFNVDERILNSEEPGGLESELDYVTESEDENLLEFIDWADQRNIFVVGVDKTASEMYHEGLKKNDFVDLAYVSGVLDAAAGLKKLPDDLLRVMSGKTIYFSVKEGRGFTILGSFPESGIFKNVNRGYILEQPIFAEDALHEFGHILVSHGIRGYYFDKNNFFGNLEREADRIFGNGGYMDDYAETNEGEDFAQHVMHYVLHGKEFKDAAGNDSGLHEKYGFFLRVFNGRKY